MALLYEYPDEYLRPFCTEDREGRAIEEVALLAGERELSAEWEAKLVVLQVYIFACLENEADPEDLFHHKLGVYRDEMELQLPRALAAADAEADVVSSVYSIRVDRA